MQTAAVNVEKEAPPQSLLSFPLTKDATFSTAKGHVAFRAVTAADFPIFHSATPQLRFRSATIRHCCVDQHGYGQFAGDGYGYEYYCGAGWVPPPIQIRSYGWHDKRWGW